MDRQFENFNIKDAFRQAFGYNPPETYHVPARAINPQQQRAGSFVIPAKTDIGQQTLTGAPLMATDIFGRDYSLPVILDGNYLPFPIITPDLDKSGVFVNLTEQRGDANLIISNGDIKFSIRGIIHRPDGKFPELEIALLNSLFIAKRSLVMQNAISDILLQDDAGNVSTSVIIMRLRFLPTGGKEIAYKPYEMEIKTDFIQTVEIAE